MATVVKESLRNGTPHCVMRGVMRGVMPYRNTSVGLHLIEAPQDVGQRRPEADDLVVLVEDLLLQRGHSLAQRVVLALHHFVCNDPIGTKKKGLTTTNRNCRHPNGKGSFEQSIFLLGLFLETEDHT